MRFVSIALSLLLLAASPAMGQTGHTAQLRVTGVDQTGASIPSAHVVVTNGAGFTAQADVDQRGQVTLTSLPVGSVRLQVQSVGFSSYDATVTLRRGNNNQTVTLGIAGLQEEIVVNET